MKEADEWQDLLENNKIFRVITEIKELLYKTDKHKLKILIDRAIKTVLDSHQLDDYIPTFEKERLKKTLVKKRLRVSSRSLDISPETVHQEFLAGTGYAYDEAVEYFINNINQVFADALEDLLIEAAYKALTIKSEKGRYILKMTENEAYKELLKMRFSYQKKRIRVTKAPGEKLYWTKEKRQGLLEEYQKLLSITRKAKQTYRKLAVLKDKNRRQTLKEEFPDLPEEIFNEITLEGKKNPPKTLVLGYLSGLHRKTSTSYLSLLLSQANNEAKNK